MEDESIGGMDPPEITSHGLGIHQRNGLAGNQ
jgi:hypothetical protein